MVYVILIVRCKCPRVDDNTRLAVLLTRQGEQRAGSQSSWVQLPAHYKSSHHGTRPLARWTYYLCSSYKVMLTQSAAFFLSRAESIDSHFTVTNSEQLQVVGFLSVQCPSEITSSQPSLIFSTFYPSFLFFSSLSSNARCHARSTARRRTHPPRDPTSTEARVSGRCPP